MKNFETKPKISIITIVLNNKIFLEHTIKSVINQDYPNIEYIIIDGGSTDGSLDVINKYKKYIHYWVSEPDKGIYDACNKGIAIASGEWLNFMNAGDRFSDLGILSKIFSNSIPDNKSFIYGDWYLCNLLENHEKIEPGYADLSLGRLLHQAIIYKKSLHDIHGNYLVTQKLIISDYIFFSLIPISEYLYIPLHIAINDKTGISSAYWSYNQKMAFDFIFGKISFKDFLYEMIQFYILNIQKSRKKRKLLEFFAKYLLKNSIIE